MRPFTGDRLARLACPRCASPLDAADGRLACTGCGAGYTVSGGVADLLPWSGGAPGPEWDRWREKLDKLVQWRRTTWDGSGRAEVRQKLADDLAAGFFEFASLPDSGAVLEIGCGGGDLRRYLPGREYWGIDPLMDTPAAGGEAVFLKGVGERLPLADGSFRALLICETLDHALDPARVLREARRVLKDGGVLAVMQNVRVPAPPTPLAARVRIAAGRLKSRMTGRRRVDDAETKMHVMNEDELAGLIRAEFRIAAGASRGAVVFIRAVKQVAAAARVPAGRP